MIEVKITFVSNSETLLGLMIDRGEYEVKENTWLPFTRLRIGFIFFTIDFTKYSKDFS